MLVAVGLKKSDKKTTPTVRVYHQIDLPHTYMLSFSFSIFNFIQKKKSSCDDEIISCQSIIISPLQRPV